MSYVLTIPDAVVRVKKGVLTAKDMQSGMSFVAMNALNRSGDGLVNHKTAATVVQRANTMTSSLHRILIFTKVRVFVSVGCSKVVNG
jgi:hypothetical protein